jgi:hypothetical protein
VSPRASNLAALLAVGAVALLSPGARATAQSTSPLRLDEHCTVSVLNRSVRVNPDGSWVLPNVPANFGAVRARATCVIDGQTISGESDSFVVPANGVVNLPRIVFGRTTPIPQALTISAASTRLTQIGATVALTVTARYGDGTQKDVTAGSTGTQYGVSNAAIATVSGDGLVQAVKAGAVVIQATHEGASSIASIQVVLAGVDTDGDGLPDEWELAHGLNPNDPIDAQEDPDRDGLTNLDEFRFGTDPRNADTDGDGLVDGREVALGTSPLLRDTDGDGIGDGLEVQTGSNPRDPGSFNLAGALSAIHVTPSIFGLTFNTVVGEASQQLKVTGDLKDGTTIDLTSSSRGTNYDSNALTICSFGGADGQVFAGLSGTCTVTATNNGFSATSIGEITNFSPTALGSIAIPGYANNVDVNGHMAYVAAGMAGLVVVDASNPAFPVIKGSLDTRPGNANDVRVVGNLAYVANGSTGLKIIDVTDPGSPRLKGSLALPGEANDVIVSGNLAFVADGPAGLQIIDITDPAAPVKLRSVPTPGIARGVDVSGSFVIVVDDLPQPGLRVIDATNPAAAAIVGSVALGGQPTDVSVGDGFAYVAAYTGGVRVVDVRQPTAPVEVGSGLPGSSPDGFVPRDVQVAGPFAIFAEQLFASAVAPIVDISTPATLHFRAVLDFHQDYAGTGIAVSGPLVYWTGLPGFVGSENGMSGDTTRLFIGQYLALEDRGGVAPMVRIAAPDEGATFVEGQSLTVRVAATDDVAVGQVAFTVDGQQKFVDTSEPYDYTFTIPTGVTTLTLGATAVDLGANTNSASSTIAVIPDPLTTVAGRVVDRNGQPLGGAQLTVLSRTAVTSLDGTFTINDVPTLAPFLVVSARVSRDTKVLTGASVPTAPVRGGTTDVGDIIAVDFGGLYGAAFTGPSGPASLYQIDAQTGGATLIGPIGFWRVTAMDVSIDGTLYAVGRDPATGKNVLLTIDPNTGAGTAIGPTGVELLGFGDTIADIAFRSDGVLFGYLEAGDGLGTINLATGAVTALGSTGVSCCGNGLAFAPDGRLLHANESQLHVMNQTTGRASLLVPLSYPIIGSGFSRISSMKFQPATTDLFGFLKSGGFSPGQTFLARVDVTTGVVTTVGAATISGLDAIAWGPR